jgi:hypothetical protein
MVNFVRIFRTQFPIPSAWWSDPIEKLRGLLKENMEAKRIKGKSNVSLAYVKVCKWDNLVVNLWNRWGVTMGHKNLGRDSMNYWWSINDYRWLFTLASGQRSVTMGNSAPCRHLNGHSRMIKSGNAKWNQNKRHACIREFDLLLAIPWFTSAEITTLHKRFERL